MTGWICIHRSSWRHDFFPKEAMTQREAFHRMVAMAAWEDTTHEVGGVVHKVPRGSFMVTLRELQTAFYWGSDSKVRNFLKRLENAEMIERKKARILNAKKTHVTICNYDKFQNIERVQNGKRTGKKRSKETNKQINNTPAGAISSIEEKIDFWAERINGDGPLASSAIGPNLARALLQSGKVTPEKLRERGIAA